MVRSPLRLAGLLAGAGLLVALSACAQQQAQSPPPADPTGALFAAGLGDIAEYYLEPTADRGLALAGFANLARLDGRLAITETAGATIVLTYDGTQRASYPEPPPDDVNAWAGLIGKLVGDARAASAKLAGLSEDRTDKAVFDGIAGALDGFSRYAGPRTARDNRAARDGRDGPTVAMSLKDGIVLLRVASFNRDTTHEVAEKLAAARREFSQRLPGVVLDLRGNPGGLLEQAVSLAELFIPAGPIVGATGRHPASRQVYAATGDTAAPHTPIVVLVDGRSASAAEIVAAALQDAGRGVVIGSASYGKGTVQTVLRLPNDGELILTWAQLMAPSGYFLHRHGVVPTVCTSDLDEGARSLAVALRRAGGADDPSPLTLQPRRLFDEAAWTRLRQSCPPRHDERAIDIEAAERLLADPGLYAQAVHGIAAGPRLAGAAAPSPALTAAGASLFSGQRIP